MSAPPPDDARTPAAILAAALATPPLDLEALCAAHPDSSEELRRLARHWEAASEVLAALGTGGALRERLARRFGAPVEDADLSLDEAPGAPSSARVPSSPSGTLARLEAEAPRTPRYRSRREIARGGMGAILEVWDEDLRRTSAMKVALTKRDPGSADKDGRLLARFLEEAQVTAQLDHPGIVPVHELGLDADGRVFFTMPLVRGRDLSQILELVREGREGWSLPRALGVLSKVCEAMAYAHSKKVIHRDLKPANVMVGRFGEVYVMDWGLAKVLGREDKRDLRLKAAPDAAQSIVSTDRDQSMGSPLMTMDGDIVGTPSYMSPEQARGDLEAMGPPADVYSIGAILYHLLAGHMPYVNPGSKVNAYAVWGMLQNGPPEPLGKQARSAPLELVAICEKAMARDPAARYADTVDMADDLRAFLEGRVVRAYSTGPVVEFKKWVQRNKALAGASAAALVALFGGLGLAYDVKARSSDTLQQKNDELEALWAQYELSKEKIDSMQAEAAEEIEAQKALARAEREQARELRDNVSELQKDVLERQRQVDAALAEAQSQSYVANMTGAAMNLAAGNFGELERRLEAAPEALRGWEWNHLGLGRSAALLSVAGGSWAAAWKGDKQFVHGTHDGALVVRDGRKGEVVALWKVGSAGISSVAVGPGLLAAGDIEGRVHLIDPEGSVPDRTLPPSTGLEVAAMTFSADGGRLVVGDGYRYRRQFTEVLLREPAKECFVHVLDVDTGEELLGWQAHRAPIRDLALLPDGAHLVTADIEGRVELWDVRDGARLRTVSVGAPVNALAAAPDGRRVLVGRDDGLVDLIDAYTGQQVGRLEGHSDAVLDVDLTADGRRAVTGSRDRSVRVWDLDGLAELAVLYGHDGEVGMVAFSPSEGRILSAGYEDGLRVWDANTDSPTTLLPRLDHRLSRPTLEYGDQRGGRASPVWLLDLDERDGVPPACLSEIAVVDPTGRRLAHVGRRSRLKRVYSVDVWDLTSETLVASFEGHSDSITAIAWDAEGALVASAGADHGVAVWDAESGLLVADLGQLPTAAGALAFAADGRLAAGCDDGHVRLLTLGQEPRVLDGRHAGGVDVLAWSPDGRWLASGSADDTVLLFDADRGSVRHHLQGHSGDVQALCFAPDGSRLFTGSQDKAVRVWHLESGVSLLILTGPRFPVTWIGLERDGRRLVTSEASATPSVRVWDSALEDAREMWRERELARRAHELVNGLYEERRSVTGVLEALGERSDLEPEVASIASRLARRLEQ